MKSLAVSLWISGIELLYVLVSEIFLWPQVKSCDLPTPLMESLADVQSIYWHCSCFQLLRKKIDIHLLINSSKNLRDIICTFEFCFISSWRNKNAKKTDRYSFSLVSRNATNTATIWAFGVVYSQTISTKQWGSDSDMFKMIFCASFDSQCLKFFTKSFPYHICVFISLFFKAKNGQRQNITNHSHFCIDTSFCQYMSWLKSFWRPVCFCSWALLTFVRMLFVRMLWDSEHGSFYLLLACMVSARSFYGQNDDLKKATSSQLLISGLCIGVEESAMLNFLYWTVDAAKVVSLKWVVARTVLKRSLRLPTSKSCTIISQSMSSITEELKHKSARVQSVHQQLFKIITLR